MTSWTSEFARRKIMASSPTSEHLVETKLKASVKDKRRDSDVPNPLEYSRIVIGLGDETDGRQSRLSIPKN